LVGIIVAAALFFFASGQDCTWITASGKCAVPDGAGGWMEGADRSVPATIAGIAVFVVALVLAFSPWGRR
jgi:hypothetical protein